MQAPALGGGRALRRTRGVVLADQAALTAAFFLAGAKGFTAASMTALANVPWASTACLANSAWRTTRSITWVSSSGRSAGRRSARAAVALPTYSVTGAWTDCT